ncbi:chaperone protein dnaJ 1, mitochondrial [Haematococcus lacustris]|uniref:Chaperone protein dnaJ 1, mitochondrial n=1 Tax=Haematococcus lacustris TaxID=44745 RepID=A0A699ZCT6_HAELA|nr:chaperone protein dnaJ 1, mitochondrial [Haematococcus lacustris]
MPCASVSPTCDDSEDADASSCTLYSTLGVSLNVGFPPVQLVYAPTHPLVQPRLMWHPDRHRHTEDDEVAKRRFQRIQAAYEVLRDESRRGHYDLRLLDQLHVQCIVFGVLGALCLEAQHENEYVGSVLTAYGGSTTHRASTYLTFPAGPQSLISLQLRCPQHGVGNLHANTISILHLGRGGAGRYTVDGGEARMSKQCMDLNVKI